MVKKVMVDIDAYYTYETHTADGSFRVFDSYVRAGADYDCLLYTSDAADE